MRRLAPIVLVGLAAALLPAPGLAQSARVGEPSWHEVSGAGFRVAGDAPVPRLQEAWRELVDQSRRLPSALAGLHLGSAGGGGRPLELFVVEGQPELTDLLPSPEAEGRSELVGGSYFPGRDTDQAVVRLEPGPLTLALVVRHEAVHAAVRASFPSTPYWLSEGLARTLSSVARRGRFSLVGSRPPRDPDLGRVGAPGRQALASLLAGAEPVDTDGLLGWQLVSCSYLDGAQRRDRLAQALSGFSAESRLGAAEALAVLGDVDELSALLHRCFERPGFDPVRIRDGSPESRPKPSTRTLPASEALARVGDFLTRRGRHQVARPYLDQALALDPHQPLAHQATARSLYARGDFEAAATHLRRALDAEVGEAASELLIATVLRSSGDGVVADWQERALESAVSARPELAASWIDLAAGRLRLGATPAEVVPLCRRAVSARPDSAWLRLLLARAEWLAGRTEDAERSAHEGVELALAGTDSVLANNLCWYGALAGLAGAVLPACEHAVTLAPGSGNIRDSRALARALTGDLAGAAADLRAFLASQDAEDPELRRTREQWLRVLERSRNPFDAPTLAALSDLPY